jgi:hypothetical protein
LIKLRVVLLVWISDGVFQQLLDAPVGQSSRGLEKVGVLFANVSALKSPAFARSICSRR